MTDKTFDQLWKHFVPRDGPPRTPQGEALRAVARISDGVTLDEGANWSEEHDAVLAKLTGHLTASPLLEDAVRTAVKRDLEVVAGRGAHPAAELRAAVTRIRECVIGWCNTKLRTPES